MVRGKRTEDDFLFLICIFNLIVIITLIPVSSAYYFESPCRSTSNCNPTNHTNFICWNAICVCDLSRQLVYDHSKNFCLRPPGGKCKSDEDCVQNAHCDNKTELCVCSPPHFEKTPSDECKAKYKCQCNDTVLCNETKFLQCTNGKCYCADGHNMYYDNKKDTCVAELGQKCELIAWMNIQMECESNAECIVNKENKDKFYGECRCKENYFAPFDTCERVVGSPCNKTDESSCQDGLLLKCHRGQCQCVDDAVFDSKYNQCRLQIGSSCHPSLEHCITNAKCTLSENVFKGTCKCEDGYAETSRGSCKATYDNYCLHDNDCFGEGSLLRCSDGICRCQLGQQYDKLRKSCVSTIGRPCNSHLNHLNVEKVHCVQNALCIPDENDFGRCLCQHPFVMLNNSSCVPGQGAPCNTSLDCHAQRGLTCSSQICSCKNTTIFDSISQMCKIKSGEICKQNDELECTDNSSCRPSPYYEYESIPHNECVCNKGFESAPDGRCLLGYGKPCHQFNNICNEYRAFTCINNTCSCESPLVFNDKLNFCQIVPQNRFSSQSNQIHCMSIHLIWLILCLQLFISI